MIDISRVIVDETIVLKNKHNGLYQTLKDNQLFGKTVGSILDEWHLYKEDRKQLGEALSQAFNIPENTIRTKHLGLGEVDENTWEFTFCYRQVLDAWEGLSEGYRKSMEDMSKRMGLDLDKTYTLAQIVEIIVPALAKYGKEYARRRRSFVTRPITKWLELTDSHRYAKGILSDINQALIKEFKEENLTSDERRLSDFFERINEVRKHYRLNIFFRSKRRAQHYRSMMARIKEAQTTPPAPYKTWNIFIAECHLIDRIENPAGKQYMDIDLQDFKALFNAKDILDRAKRYRSFYGDVKEENKTAFTDIPSQSEHSEHYVKDAPPTNTEIADMAEWREKNKYFHGAQKSDKENGSTESGELFITWKQPEDSDGTYWFTKERIELISKFSHAALEDDNIKQALPKIINIILTETK